MSIKKLVISGSHIENPKYPNVQRYDIDGLVNSRDKMSCHAEICSISQDMLVRPSYFHTLDPNLTSLVNSHVPLDTQLNVLTFPLSFLQKLKKS